MSTTTRFIVGVNLLMSERRNRRIGEVTTESQASHSGCEGGVPERPAVREP